MDELRRRIGSNKSMTAAEAVDLFNSCPEWVAQNAELDANRAATERHLRAEEAPIIFDLAKVGVEIESVWDLVNTNEDYSVAIPALLNHLKRPYHHRIRNGIIRALTTPEARGLVGEGILRELGREEEPENRWALANALTVVADQSNAIAIRALFDDPAYEDVRERLGEALDVLQKEPR